MNLVNPPRLLAVGGAHMDRRGRLDAPHIPATSNPGRMREDVGGGIFNAARMAGRRGVAVSLLSLRGGDAAGDTVARAIEEAGFEDLSATFLDRATPSYTAILDHDGELITGLADMALYDMAFARQMRRSKTREAASRASAILCDANMPAEAVARLAAIRSTSPLYAIAVSPAKAGRLVPHFADLAALFLNAREARGLAGLETGAPVRQAVDSLRDLGLRAAVITDGSRAVTVFDGENHWQIEPPLVETVVDVTGAGDALTGASIAALMRGLPLQEAAREGVAASGLAIASAAAAPEFDDSAFNAALARVPAPRSVS
ncbi:carbohydrate kinase family protein [Nitratireductor sp. L1-7-SE]|uniref:Carbohydrate kinase family protein n=1 Tax=Nitratireductor rhodophyticola TaxID=2854036 RepID=A0ABS7R273_9HYPH|nr:carbohydrate kinase family protein [Nitratireductor rhodophyticola]MBY8915042.1 carbohydrate kinase family protein [Nitratireductor rhodophyticola]MBY8919888.1 carbohydrate kinase family protein [Nitratireductor rhodophyticola]